MGGNGGLRRQIDAELIKTITQVASMGTKIENIEVKVGGLEGNLHEMGESIKKEFSTINTKLGDFGVFKVKILLIFSIISIIMSVVIQLVIVFAPLLYSYIATLLHSGKPA